MKKFSFKISGYYVLTEDEVWPDGDGPENPTAEDVLDLIDKLGGAEEVIWDWNLEPNLEVGEV